MSMSLKDSTVKVKYSSSTFVNYTFSFNKKKWCVLVVTRLNLNHVGVVFFTFTKIKETTKGW